MTISPALRLEQEAWLRRNGLPLLIPARHRIARVIYAAAPALLMLVLLASAVTVIDHAIVVEEGIDLEDIVERLDDAQLTEFALGLIIGICSIPASIGYQIWQRRRHRTTKMIGGLVIALLWMSGVGLLASGLSEDFFSPLSVPFWGRALTLLGLYLLTFWEAPSIVRWAGARVLRELSTLGPMIARVLPFLLLAQLLVFFTNEIWQLAASLNSPRVWALNGILILPILILVGSHCVEALRREFHRSEIFRGDLLKGTPFEGLPAIDKPRQLRKGEGVNLLLLPMLAQLIQIGLFIALLCLFFLGFGSVAVDGSVIATWTGKPSVRMTWLGIKLPIDLTMFRVSLMLAVFSGLSFAASNTTDEQYRKIFLNPIIDEMELNLAVRRVYTASH